MSFEVKGKLHKIFPTEQKSASFSAREFVIELPGQYTNFIKFQLTQDRCSLIESYNEGDEINVHFDLRGREWQGKYFTNLNAWRIEAGATEAPAAPPAGNSMDGQFLELGDNTGGGEMRAEDFDDLPF